MKSMTSGAWKQLALTSIRELVRDKATFFFVLIFPFLFMFLFVFIGSTDQDVRYKVGLVQPVDADPAVQEVAAAFRQVSVLEVQELQADEMESILQRGSLKVGVSLPPTFSGPQPIRISSSADSNAQAALVQAILRDMTRPPGGPSIESSVASEGVNAVDFGLPAVLILAFFSLATMGTMAPIIQMRERGSLRILGLTPLPRSTFILAHLSARFVLGLVQLTILLSIAYVLDKLPVNRLPAIIGMSVLGLLMLFSLGYALAGLVPSVEVANGVGGGMMPIILMFCGVMMPFEVLPEWVATAARFIPVTYLGDALRTLILGSTPMFDMWVSVLVLAVSTAAFAALATVTFRWDRRQERKSTPKRAMA